MTEKYNQKSFSQHKEKKKNTKKVTTNNIKSTSIYPAEKSLNERNISSRSPLFNFIAPVSESSFKVPSSKEKQIKANVGSPLGRSASFQNISSHSSFTSSSKLAKKIEKSKKEKSSLLLHFERRPKKETPIRDRYLPRIATDIECFREKFFYSYDDSITSKSMVHSNVDAVLDERQQIIRERLLTEEMSNVVLSYENDLPTSNEAGTTSTVKFQTKDDLKGDIKPSWSRCRFIPKTAERTLDAPDLVDNFYYNVLDWGGSNQISVGLEGIPYLWNATSGHIIQLETQDPNPLPSLANPNTVDHVCSMRWSGQESSSCLAVGKASGYVQLWDARTQKCIRRIKAHDSRIGSLSWNRHILSTGSQSGQIVNIDVRVANCIINRIDKQHKQEVCALVWSPDGRHLASGGNDNLVNVWNISQLMSATDPLHTLSDHTAAVKAVSWHPRITNLLATGGGTSCGRINLFNVGNGQRLTSVETNSQVTGIVWSNYYNEFVSAHGYPHNRLTLWSYPTMTPVCHLTGHTQRILSIVPNPDGSTVASIGGDETLRLWRCFAIPKNAQLRNSDDIFRKTTPLNLIR